MEDVMRSISNRADHDRVLEFAFFSSVTAWYEVTEERNGQEWKSA